MVRRLSWSLLMLALYSLEAVWLTRPLAWRLNDAAYDFRDPLYTIWALDHNYRTILSGRWDRYWQAPMFWDYPLSLALADAHLGTALWSWPAYLASGDAVTAHNLAMLGSYVLTALAAYLLAHAVCGIRWLSLLLGAAAAAAPFRLAQVEHIQVLQTQWLVLSAWCLLRSQQRPHWGYVTGFGLCCWLTLTSSLYLGVLQALLFGPWLVVAAVRHGWYRPSHGLFRAWVWTSVLLLVAAAWFLQPYIWLYRNEGFMRRMSDVIRGSAQPDDLRQLPGQHLLAGLPLLRPGPVEFCLFPGMLVTAGLVAASWLCVRNAALLHRVRSSCRWLLRWCKGRPAESIGVASGSLLLVWFITAAPFGSTAVDLRHDFVVIPWRAVAGTLVLVSVAAVLVALLPVAWQRGWLHSRGLPFWCLVGLAAFVLLSFGPVVRHKRSELALGPYALLYRYFPGYRNMRVPARFCVIWQPLLVMLGAWAGRRICSPELKQDDPQVPDDHAGSTRAGGARWASRGWVVGIGAAALLGADLATGPMRWVKLAKGDEVPAVFRWLRDHGKPGGVVVLPISDPYRAVNPPYLYFSLTHRRPLLNAYPAFTPQECRQALVLAGQLPAKRSVEMLRRRGIRYLVLDGPTLRASKGAAEYEELYRRCRRSRALRLVSECPDADRPLFELCD